MSSKIAEIRAQLNKLSEPKKAQVLKSFFKTGSGQYAEGDIFLGVAVPQLRELARTYKDISLQNLLIFFHSPIHEERLLALLVLVSKYKTAADKALKRSVYCLYLKNIKYVNNWDLVDLTAHHIIGDYLFDKDKDTIYKLAGSEVIWQRRIAIVSTFFYIKKNIFNHTLDVAAMLLYDSADLIHKAVGWMLREVGKRNRSEEEVFLKKHYKTMPRTMLRYAIERFPEKSRQAYLKSKV
ncbi:MAG: DNA alkylation repair protein [Candidatus Omnitrophica bacterium]|nr:DNA alkylation repair protein [Candidatus Omnitrophota bacterium]